MTPYNIPGTPYTLASAESADLRAQADALIADCSQVIYDIRGNLKQYVNGCIVPCRQSMTACADCVIGTAAMRVDATGALLSRCREKLSGAVVSLVSQVYSSWVMMGLPAPTPQDVSAFGATGRPTLALTPIQTCLCVDLPNGTYLCRTPDGAPCGPSGPGGPGDGGPGGPGTICPPCPPGDGVCPPGYTCQPDQPPPPPQVCPPTCPPPTVVCPECKCPDCVCPPAAPELPCCEDVTGDETPPVTPPGPPIDPAILAQAGWAISTMPPRPPGLPRGSVYAGGRWVEPHAAPMALGISMRGAAQGGEKPYDPCVAWYITDIGSDCAPGYTPVDNGSGNRYCMRNSDNPMCPPTEICPDGSEPPCIDPPPPLPPDSPVSLPKCKVCGKPGCDLCKSVGKDPRVQQMQPFFQFALPPDFCDSDSYFRLKRYIEIIEKRGNTAFDLFGWESSKGFPRIPGINDPPSGNIWLNLVQQATALLVGADIALLDFLTTKVLGSGPCASGAMSATIWTDAMSGFVERWIGADMSVFRRPMRYFQNFMCQTVLPTVDETVELYLRGEATPDQRDTWLKANGWCLDFGLALVDARITRPNIADNVMLRRREIIDATVYNDRLGKLGALNDANKEEWYRLSEFIPPYSDLVRFMVRDVMDEKAVAAYGYDKDFGDKFTGIVKDWARWQGIDERVFLAIWRAHWKIPQYTMLAECLHRLRPELYGPPGPRTLTVDRATVRQALEIDDMAPAWVDRLIEISYRPLTRVDTKRAYAVGSLDAAGIRSSYLDQGYAPPNAEILTRFAVRERDIVQRRSLGAFSEKQMLFMVATEEFTEPEVRAELLARGYSEERIADGILQAAELWRKKRRDEIAAAVKKTFMQGGISMADATATLINWGWTINAANRLTVQWREMLGLRYRAPTQMLLCRWRTEGFIDREEHYSRLLNLGYEEEDAELMTLDCEYRILVKIMKATEAEIRKADAALRRVQKEAESAARREESLQYKIKKDKFAQRQVIWKDYLDVIKLLLAERKQLGAEAVPAIPPIPPVPAESI